MSERVYQARKEPVHSSARSVRSLGFWPVGSCVGVVVLLFLLNYLFRPFAPTPFDVFRTSVSTNRNLDKIVFWARSVLAETNNQDADFELKEGLQLEVKHISQGQLPKEAFDLRTGILGGYLDPPNAAIYRDLAHTHYFLAVNYGSGREQAYGITVGATNFTMPSGKVKQSEQLKEGVFVYGN